MNVLIENIRTFQGEHEIPIRPITILTGENSSGKSTFLACLSAITNRTTFPLEPGFNTPPYSLGTYDTIASRFGKAEYFSLGWRDRDAKVPSEESASFRSVSGAMKLCGYNFAVGDNVMSLTYDNEDNTYDVSLTFDGKGRKKKSYSITKFSRPAYFGGNNFPQMVLLTIMEAHARAELPWSEIEVFLEFRRRFSETLSVAPVRTRPERTYDWGTETTTPEGGHIPYILARVLRQAESTQGKKLLKALVRFGEESGLFKNIKVRELGRKESDPFQVQANVSGRPTNLTDVGYGVSQSLPVVIESVLAANNRRVLIQQPEVHLHPRAQAALGSFFVDLVRSDQKEFVIETHSDYVVDRIRQEIARGKIESKDVVILYFQRSGARTKIHPLNLDKVGNIKATPSGYRDFFLREEINLLTRGKS